MEDISVEGVVDPNHKPAVVLRVDGKSLLLDVAGARELAVGLLRCAESAETDSFLWSFFAQKFEGQEIDNLAIGAVMMEFRHYRAGIWGNTVAQEQIAQEILARKTTQYQEDVSGDHPP